MTGGTGRVGVGVIGAGVISGTYLENMTAMPDLEVLFVADIDLDRGARAPRSTACRTTAPSTICSRWTRSRSS